MTDALIFYCGAHNIPMPAAGAKSLQRFGENLLLIVTVNLKGAGWPLSAGLAMHRPKIAAAQAAGGDRRGQQSASLLVVEKDAGYAKLSDTVVDLRVDDHERPIAELRRIFAIHRELFGVTPPEDWVDVDEPLAEELESRLAKLGFGGELGRAFADWAGKENLEERVNGIERVDPVVLEALRKASG